MTTPATVTPDAKHTTDYVTAWAAPSRTHSHVTHIVTYDRLYNEWACQCTGFHYHKHCAHIDRAIDDLAQQWRTPAEKAKVA